MANAMNRWEPGGGLSLRDAMNQLFEESFVRPFNRNGGNGTNFHYLPLDIYETEDAFVVKAFVPGASAEHLDITVQQNTLAIRVEQPVEQQEGVRYYLRERAGGTWFRSLELPAAIDGDHIDARLENGVLTLMLPKAPEARPHKVQIKAS